MPNYKQLAKTRHPEYDADYWCRLRALYAGGKCMGLDRSKSGRAILGKILPMYPGEEPEIYKQRLDTAAYVNYMGEIIDYIAAAIGSSPITLKFEPENVDPYYQDLYQDVTPSEARKQSFNQHLRHLLVDALQCGSAWTLVDLPEVDGEAPRSRAEEEASGARDAYLCHLDAEQVVDWEYDEDGDELLWASVCSITARRESIEADRSMIREQYTVYDRDGWKRYSFEYKCFTDGRVEYPDDKVEAKLDGEGKHSFGVVPLIRFCLPDGLWAGNKIASLAEAHFNKRSAFDWGQKKTLFQFLGVFEAALDPLNPATEDAKRFEKQKVGPGRYVVMGDKDRIEYISPSAEPYKVALDDMDKLRDEIHRVMHHMALSVENNASAVKRSADSKKQDQASTAVVLKGLGELLREHAEETIELVARGRGEYGTFEVEAQGADEFDDVSLDSLMQEAATIETQLHPKSATFKKRYSMKWMKRALGTDATEQDIEDIRGELEENITNEDTMASANPLGLLPGEDPAQAQPGSAAPQVGTEDAGGVTKPKPKRAVGTKKKQSKAAE